MGWVVLMGGVAATGAQAGATGGVAWGALAGIVAGWALKTVTDILMERRRRSDAAEARREQRFDALRSRRIEAERANLLALQPLVTEFMLAGARCCKAPRNQSLQGELFGPEFEIQREAMRVQSAAIMAIRARLHDRNIAKLLGDLTATGMGAVHQLVPSDSMYLWEDVLTVARECHEEVGATIRRLEDESVQLVAPPNRA